jgi:hypothetical protein
VSGPIGSYCRLAGSVLACAAAVLAAAPAVGQSVVCCNIVVQVNGNWIGMSGDCKGALKQASRDVLAKACAALANCPEARASCPACDQAKIDGLVGRLKALQNSDLEFQKSEGESNRARAKARDQLWGKGEGLKFDSGSIVAFQQSMLDSMMLAGGGATGVGKAYSEAKGTYTKAKDWAEKGWNLGSDPGNVENWADFGKEMLEMQADAIFEQRARGAIRAANQHFQKTGNYVGAQNVYRQTWNGYGNLKDFKDSAGKFTDKANKLAGALGTLQKLYENTDKVANDLQDWYDAYQDTKRAEKDREKIADEIERVSAEIARLREACGQKPGAWQRHELPSARPDALVSRHTDLDGRLLRVANLVVTPTSGAADATAQRAKRALNRLKILQESLHRADADIGRHVVTPFSPWLAGVWREAKPPQLLVELVKASRADLGRFDKTLREIEGAGNSALKALQEIPRDTGQ